MKTQNNGSLTPQQLEFYDREGYLVLEELLNEGTWPRRARR